MTRRQLLGAAFLGLMLPLLGNGMVSVAENLGAPSGVAALLIAVAPLMIVVFRFVEGDRPRPLTLVGVLLGFAGLAVLVLVGGGAVGGFPRRAGAAGAVRVDLLGARLLPAAPALAAAGRVRHRGLRDALRRPDPAHRRPAVG